MSTSYKELLHNITTIILDVDGVLTDGSLLINESGELLRIMNAKDGYAMKVAQQKGLKVVIITGGNNMGVKQRLEGLGIVDVYMNAHDKMAVLNDVMSSFNLTKDEILYMGDDMPDVPVIDFVGCGTCPQDAIPEVKAVSNYISHKNGGKGCVREIIEQVLKVQGKWNVDSGSTATSS